MKKWIVLIMALTFALGLTSMVLAAEDKKPGVPGLGPEEKGQIADTKKKATVEKKAGDGSAPAGLGPEEKAQMADTKKKATVKKKVKKAGPPPGLGPEEKAQWEASKKKGTVEKMQEKKEAAPPAEKK